MLPRTLSRTLLSASKTFPAVVLTGPRQSGKTTLFKHLYGSTHRYANLEDLSTRQLALADPIKFLENFPPPVIIDEIQYAPDLLSYINVRIDESRTPNQWLLTESQNFILMKNVSQSLAGRAAVVSLLPLSVSESQGFGNQSLPAEKMFTSGGHPRPTLNLAQTVLNGGYPEVSANPEVNRKLWFDSYLSTYLERDIRNLNQIGSLSDFAQFITACAVRTGQILDLSSLARDLGISVPTARRWLSLLETGYQIYLLYPYYENLGKRLVKRPKLYFTDTGLASFLMGIHVPETLNGSPQFGQLFETLVVTDFVKRFQHHGDLSRLYYLRTRDGLEIDLVIQISGKLALFEIKSSSTITPKHASSLVKFAHTIPDKVVHQGIISTSPHTLPLPHDVINYSWSDLLLR